MVTIRLKIDFETELHDLQELWDMSVKEWLSMELSVDDLLDYCESIEVVE